VGRTLFSATAIQGVSLRLRKYTLQMQLRFLESEWPGVKAFVAWAQGGESFLWYPGSNDPEQEPEPLTVYLELPRVATIVSPVRDGDYLSMFTLSITLSRMDQPWPLEYFRIPFGA
jgi:hypothetical protein